MTSFPADICFCELLSCSFKSQTRKLRAPCLGCHVCAGARSIGGAAESAGQRGADGRHAARGDGGGWRQAARAQMGGVDRAQSRADGVPPSTPTAHLVLWRQDGALQRQHCT
eukprot:279724-Pleurochrysis_carterae.AAC.1